MGVHPAQSILFVNKYGNYFHIFTFNFHIQQHYRSQLIMAQNTLQMGEHWVVSLFQNWVHNPQAPSLSSRYNQSMRPE